MLSLLEESGGRGRPDARRSTAGRAEMQGMHGVGRSLGGEVGQRRNYLAGGEGRGGESTWLEERGAAAIRPRGGGG